MRKLAAAVLVAGGAAAVAVLLLGRRQRLAAASKSARLRLRQTVHKIKATNLLNRQYSDIHDRLGDSAETRMLSEFMSISKELRIEKMFGRVVAAIYRLMAVQRAAVFLVDEDAGVLRLINSSDACGITVPLGKGVAGDVARTGRTEVVQDAYADARFDRSTDEFTGFRTHSILCVPVMSEDGEDVVAVLQTLNKHSGGEEQAPFENADVMLLEVLASLLTGLFARGALFEEVSREKSKASALLMTAQAVHEVGSNSRERAGKITRAIQDGLDCERVALMIVDEVNDSLAIISNDSESGRRIPIGTGIVGEVVKSGEVIVIANAYDDERFDTQLDRQTGFHTHSVLAVPIMRRGRCVGVIEMLNKSKGTFDETDEELATAVALQVADSLLPNLLRDLVTGGLEQEEEMMELGANLLTEYSSGDLRTTGALSPRKQSSARERAAARPVQRGSSILPGKQQRGSALGASILKSRLRASVSVSRLTKFPEGMNLEMLHSWDFNIWAYSEAELLQVASALLDITGLIDQFGIKLQPLSSLLQAVCAGYRPNPYHNFQHAVSVLHVSYLLHRAGPPNVEGNDQPPVVLSKLELLALFLAALGHDIDHPGVTNAFLCNSYAPLALCYNDESVLENHHAATTWTLLNDSRNDVLGGLAVEERKQVRNLIIKSILATDMAHHSHMVKHLTELAADHKPIEVMDVLTTVLHLADLSNPVQEWSLSRRWAQLVCQEFRNQTSREEELGLPVAPHLAKLDTDADIAKLQLGFLDFVVAPLWNAAAMLFPGAKERLDQLKSNRASWQREKEIALAGGTSELSSIDARLRASSGGAPMGTGRLLERRPSDMRDSLGDMTPEKLHQMQMRHQASVEDALADDDDDDDVMTAEEEAEAMADRKRRGSIQREISDGSGPASRRISDDGPPPGSPEDAITKNH